MSPAPILRPARPDDALPIAALHAASWQSAYRGSLSDAYLDGPVEAERQAVWAERFGAPVPGQIVILAEAADPASQAALVGFVCAFAAHDAVLGSLIDNLHVRPDRKRQGLGRTLMRSIAAALERAAPAKPVHLSVLEANHPARHFYARLGGEAFEQCWTVVPDGSEVGVLHIRWPSPAHLIAAASNL
jgi:ribosomal protein S18 acetylase RimI-like enzyme